MNHLSTVLFLILFLPFTVFSQNSSLDPTFDLFEGTVYTMPKMYLKIRGYVTKTILERYDEKVYSYDSLTTISLKSLNIPETYIQEGSFPGVNQSTKFCMLLNSVVTIKEHGYYEFTLNSDDGSILWIDDKEIVNNDGGHPMKMTKEVIELKAGIYPIKIWYFQGHPDRFGLEFDAVYKGSIKNPKPIIVKLPSDILFQFQESLLTQKAKGSLDQVIQDLDKEGIKVIEVVGHTDDVGTDEGNQRLSLERANNVADYLRSITPQFSIRFKAKGKGVLGPIESNSTALGRARNRRVELPIFKR